MIKTRPPGLMLDLLCCWNPSVAQSAECSVSSTPATHTSSMWPCALSRRYVFDVMVLMALIETKRLSDIEQFNELQMGMNTFRDINDGECCIKNQDCRINIFIVHHRSS